MNAKLKQRKSIRLKHYDYSRDGFYYVTVCTRNREHVFGDVLDGQMVLNETGEIVEFWWKQLPVKYESAASDAYVIMPNHFHGIIQIVGAGSPRPNDTQNDADQLSGHNGRGNRAPTLGNMVAYFKYGSTKQINQLRDTPGKSVWQRGYHEHIIRNESDLNKIREYIHNNPNRWGEDIYYGSK